MNTFGEKWAFTSFGESHGRAIGGVLDGIPAGIRIDMKLIEQELLRRKTPLLDAEGTPDPTTISTRAQHEPDKIEWLSGVLDGITTGTPLAFIIRNTDARPEDYEYLKHTFRPGHADYTYQKKYGMRDYRGGGRASARETAARVVAGTIARQQLAERGITIQATLEQVGGETNPARFAEAIKTVRGEGDSLGGIVSCTIHGIPAGTGEPIFDKLQAHLAFAILSINACRGFEFGTGFAGADMRGSEANRITGGILGGIADGTDIHFRAVFKPTPSIACEQPLEGIFAPSDPSAPQTLRIHGRHDPCVAVRAVPVVEAMTALALVQFFEE